MNLDSSGLISILSLQGNSSVQASSPRASIGQLRPGQVDRAALQLLPVLRDTPFTSGFTKCHLKCLTNAKVFCFITNPSMWLSTSTTADDIAGTVLGREGSHVLGLLCAGTSLRKARGSLCKGAGTFSCRFQWRSLLKGKVLEVPGD